MIMSAPPPPPPPPGRGQNHNPYASYFNNRDNDESEEFKQNSGNNGQGSRLNRTNARGSLIYPPGSNTLLDSGTTGGGGAPPPPSLQPTQSQMIRAATASALHRKTPSLSSYQTTPITKHYQINNQILAAFESHYEHKLYQIAYAMGLQFVETALLEIPKHGYFYSSRHERERMQSSLEAVRVTHLLQEMQQQDVNSTPTQEERVNKLSFLALEQVERASQDQYETNRARTEREIRSAAARNVTDAEWVVCEPLLAAQESLSRVFCPTTEQNAPSNSLPTAIATPIAHVPATETPVLPLPRGYHQQGRSQSDSAAGGTVVPMPRGYDLQGQQQSQSERGRTAAERQSLERRPSDAVARELLASWPDWIGDSSRSSIGFVAGADQTTQLRRTTTDDSMLEKALYLSGLEVTPDYNASYAVADDGTNNASMSAIAPPPPPQRATAGTASIPPPPPSASSGGGGERGGGERLHRQASNLLELRTLSTLYHEDFDYAQSTGRVRISFCSTYQGRTAESTNGCTVIAPLLCIHHLLEHDDVSGYYPDPGLPDPLIEQVIDIETPAILTHLRQTLGLSPTAFLIPSDAHDYLIQHGQLSQQQFVHVIGGNVLDDLHLQALLDALQDPPNTRPHHQQSLLGRGGHHQHNKPPRPRKIAATLFFHEHVVAILKLRRNSSTVWYDLIDSLPLKDTLRHLDESEEEFMQRLNLIGSPTSTSSSRLSQGGRIDSNSNHDGHHNANNGDPNEVDDEAVLMTQNFVPKTARVRCLDVEALKATIRWYACSKFSEENVTYCDLYAWDDTSVDFDPRVFQAFVWGDAQEE